MYMRNCSSSKGCRLGQWSNFPNHAHEWNVRNVVDWNVRIYVIKKRGQPENVWGNGGNPVIGPRRDREETGHDLVEPTFNGPFKIMVTRVQSSMFNVSFSVVTCQWGFWQTVGN